MQNAFIRPLEAGHQPHMWITDYPTNHSQHEWDAESIANYNNHLYYQSFTRQYNVYNINNRNRISFAKLLFCIAFIDDTFFIIMINDIIDYVQN